MRTLGRIPEKPIIDEAVRQAKEQIMMEPPTTVNSAILLSNPHDAGNVLYAKYVLLDFDSSLPNAVAIGALPANVIPDASNRYQLGWWNRIWKNVITSNFTIRKTESGPQATYDYDTWFTNLGHMLPSVKIVIDGYGAHRYYVGAPYGAIWIQRNVAFDKNKIYTSIKHYSICGWYAPYDVSNTTGLGIMRPCVDNASHLNPGVEFELDDFGNDSYIVCRFRNFFHQRVVVGCRIIA